MARLDQVHPPGSLAPPLGPHKIEHDSPLVLDFINNAERVVETLWTGDPSFSFSLIDHKIVETTPDINSMRMQVFSEGYPKAKMELLHGSYKPFAGWIIQTRTPTAAPAIRILQPGTQSVRLTHFRLLKTDNQIEHTHLSANAKPELWKIDLFINGKSIIVHRNRETIRIEYPQDNQETAVKLLASPDIKQQQTNLRRAMEDALNQYPQWRDLSFYRVKITYAILAIAFMIEIISLFLQRRTSGRVMFTWSCIVITSWIVIIASLEIFYF